MKRGKRIQGSRQQSVPHNTTSLNVPSYSILDVLSVLRISRKGKKCGCCLASISITWCALTNGCNLMRLAVYVSGLWEVLSCKDEGEIPALLSCIYLLVLRLSRAMCNSQKKSVSVFVVPVTLSVLTLSSIFRQLFIISNALLTTSFRENKFCAVCMLR